MTLRLISFLIEHAEILTIISVLLAGLMKLPLMIASRLFPEYARNTAHESTQKLIKIMRAITFGFFAVVLALSLILMSSYPDLNNTGLRSTTVLGLITCMSFLISSFLVNIAENLRLVYYLISKVVSVFFSKKRKQKLNL